MKRRTAWSLPIAGLAVCILVAAGSAQGAQGRARVAAEQDPEAVARQRAELRERLDALRKEIAEGEASRAEAADALKESEQAISDTNRNLRELRDEQRATQGQLVDLGRKQKATRADVELRQGQLAALLHRQYLSGGQDRLRALLSGEDPNRIGREWAYVGYLSRAQADLVRSLRVHLKDLADLEQASREKKADLDANANKQADARTRLLKQSAQRKKVLGSLQARIAAQRREAGALERNEKRLSRLVDELAKMIARRDQDAARSRTAPAARPDETEATGAPSRVLGRNDLSPDASLAGAFAQTRGRLRLPARGELTARYGTSRPDGGPSWKGLFIRAAAGTEVKAVAGGRVVYAEWLRGFGNLLIVDHGDQYLSIYGNNESLLKQPGDAVKAGDVVAAVGNSGGNPEPGVYFELRHKGQPFDPLKWASLR